MANLFWLQINEISVNFLNILLLFLNLKVVFIKKCRKNHNFIKHVCPFKQGKHFIETFLIEWLTHIIILILSQLITTKNQELSPCNDVLRIFYFIKHETQIIWDHLFNLVRQKVWEIKSSKNFDFMNKFECAQ